MTIEEHIKKAMQYCPLTEIQENALLTGLENYLSELENSSTSKNESVIPPVIKSLPEYNEILYHAKTLTDEQFREYWNEIQGNVL